MNAKTGLFTLKTANGKREKWWETRDHVVFLPFAFAVNVMLNFSNCSPYPPPGYKMLLRFKSLDEW